MKRGYFEETEIRLANLIIQPGTQMYRDGWRTGRCSVLLEDFHYVDRRERRHTARAGLLTDGGTFEIGWYSFDRPFGQFLAAYVVHDQFCADVRDVESTGDHVGAVALRKSGDRLMPEMMQALDAPLWKWLLAWVCVRVEAKLAGF